MDVVITLAIDQHTKILYYCFGLVVQRAQNLSLNPTLIFLPGYYNFNKCKQKRPWVGALV